MNGTATASVRLKVSPEVARIVRDASRETRLAAARGSLPLSGEDLLTALFFLVHGGDPELRALAAQTVRTLSPAVLVPLVGNPAAHPQILDLVARLRLEDRAVMEGVLANPVLSSETLVRVAARAEGDVLALIVRDEERMRSAPGIIEAILSNPRADRELKLRLGWREEGEVPPEEAGEDDLPAEESGEEPGEGEPGTEPGEEAAEESWEEVEEVNLSKYQMALQMEVAEKIKFALTGDKEWRTIFLKDTNKLVCSAALKNPRITDGEVLAVAKNKSANDELIRLITLNQEWVKNYEIVKALVHHPRTPLPKALRYMNVLTPKDLKTLAKSRAVSQVLANNARRLLMAREKNR